MKIERNSGKRITPETVMRIKQLVQNKVSVKEIGIKIGRSEKAVRNIAFLHNISLKPTNQQELRYSG